MIIEFSVATERFPSAVAMIDAADRDLVFDGRGDWKAVGVGYARKPYVMRYRKGEGRGASDERLHRLVCGVTSPLVIVDHRNGCTFDCRRFNLRRAEHEQNMRNRAPTAGRELPKGVMAHGDRFRAKITVDRRCFHLGIFTTVEAAAAAYNMAAIQHFGEFARLNYGGSSAGL